MVSRKLSYIENTRRILAKSLFNKLIALSVMIGLVFFAVKAYLDMMDTVTVAKYDWVMKRFSLSVGHIHKQWLFNNKPSRLTLQYYTQQQQTVAITVRLNRFGWPLTSESEDKGLNCHNLWRLFAREERHKNSMLDLTSDLLVKSKATGCEFYHQQGTNSALILSYNVQNGKVGKDRLNN